MADLKRQQYLTLMAEIEELEDRAANLDKEIQVMRDSPNPKDIEVTQQELQDIGTILAEKRSELARISDGCGKPHHM